MESQGAFFGVPQDILMAMGDSERCVNCHGPGKEKDVRKVHEVGDDDREEDRHDHEEDRHDEGEDHHEDDDDHEEDHR